MEPFDFSKNVCMYVFSFFGKIYNNEKKQKKGKGHKEEITKINKKASKA
jgi:hypothetical protein